MITVYEEIREEIRPEDTIRSHEVKIFRILLVTAKSRHTQVTDAVHRGLLVKANVLQHKTGV